jgi:hypothetical protein
MKTYGGIDPRILVLGISCRRMGRFTSLPLYLRRKSPLYLLDGRLDGTQSRSGRCKEEKILAPTETRTPTSSLPIATPIALSRLLLSEQNVINCRMNSNSE